ncbi:hypothetical protein GCM10011416_19660 [Polaribacter pacificus]|uniref:Copper chaperone CopZ n=1 Tax=Polaribacter pacificus TaxID=1775173 RepID=A0A917I071_9FLAO|nr:hypothetical protein [Polaribacter pacificus]GGH01054.1 hypothetical protein GCM10011416_19660 [Polaribacter pacificus]
MKLLILRTDIKTKKKVKKIKPIFNNHPIIYNWSIDIEDIDNVLRIEADDHLNEEELKKVVMENGFYCEDLPDILPQ